MAINIMKQFMINCRRSLDNKALRFYGIYQPPYLKAKETEILYYPVLNIRIRGYVFSILESYQSFIHKIANVIDVNIKDGFAYPHQEFKVTRFKKCSAIIEEENNIRLYERNIQISNVSSTKYPILVRLLEATLPEGVFLNIDKYDPEVQKKRYIPDVELITLKNTLKTVGKRD